MADWRYGFDVGDFRCVAIRDGGHMGSADILFVNAPAEELNNVLQDRNLEPDQLRSTWTCLLVDTRSELLLIDTGIGSGVGPIGGHLLDGLKQEGYTADDIDVVFLSHGHPDHIGGCTDENGKPVFAQARYVMAKEEYDFWTGEENLSKVSGTMADFARRNLPPLEKQLELITSAGEILPGVQVIDAFGHTPGHLGLEIKSHGEKILYLADSVLHPIHIEKPEWYAKVDMLPERTVETRKRLLGRAATEKVKLLLFHFDFPSVGYVVNEGAGMQWRPVQRK